MNDTKKKRLPYIIGGIFIALTLFLTGFAVAKTTGPAKKADMARHMEMSEDGRGRHDSRKDAHQALLGDLEVALRKVSVDDKQLTLTVKLENDGTGDLKLSDALTKVTATQGGKELAIQSGAWNSDNKLYSTTLKADTEDSFEMVLTLDNTDDEVEITFASPDDEKTIRIRTSRPAEKEERAFGAKTEDGAHARDSVDEKTGVTSV